MSQEFKWINNFFLQKKKQSAKGIVSYIAFDFNSYFIIEYNQGIIEDFPFDEYPENNQTLEELNKQIFINKKYGIFPEQKKSILYKKISIRQIADKFGVDYSYKTLNLIKQTPGIMPLFEITIHNLRCLIEKLISSEEELYLFIEDIMRNPFETKFKEENILKDSSEYFEFLDKLGVDFCSYLYTDNHKWCLMTIEDSNNFILGCDEEICDSALKTVEGLEYFRIEKEELQFLYAQY